MGGGGNVPFALQNPLISVVESVFLGFCLFFLAFPPNPATLLHVSCQCHTKGNHPLPSELLPPAKSHPLQPLPRVSVLGCCPASFNPPAKTAGAGKRLSLREEGSHSQPWGRICQLGWLIDFRPSSAALYSGVNPE